MKKVLEAIKKYSLWIIGGLVAIVAALLAVEYEKKKIAKLKTNLNEYKNKIKNIDDQQKVLDLNDSWFQKKENEIDESIEKSKKKVSNLDEKIKKEREDVAKMDVEEMLDEFNKLYPPSA